MPAWMPPAHWPVFGDGFLMAAIDDVMFVYVAADLSDRGFEAQLKELADAIDSRAIDTRIGVIYDVGLTLAVDARRRKRSGEVLAARKAKLARTTAAFALVTESVLVRGALRAVFWLAPPPYPWEVVRTVHDGLVSLQARLPHLDVVGIERRYDLLRARFPLERAKAR